MPGRVQAHTARANHHLSGAAILFPQARQSCAPAREPWAVRLWRTSLSRACRWCTHICAHPAHTGQRAPRHSKWQSLLPAHTPGDKLIQRPAPDRGATPSWLCTPCIAGGPRCVATAPSLLQRPHNLAPSPASPVATHSACSHSTAIPITMPLRPPHQHIDPRLPYKAADPGQHEKALQPPANPEAASNPV
jgi:hypothetical protein